MHLLGCSQDLADFEDGVYFTGTWEQGSECVQFGHDAAHGPLVYGGAVGHGSEQHLWGAVPGGGGGTLKRLFSQVIIRRNTSIEHMTLIMGEFHV